MSIETEVTPEGLRWAAQAEAFLTALKPYRDKWGLVHGAKLDTNLYCQNAALFTAHAAVIYRRLKFNYLGLYDTNSVFDNNPFPFTLNSLHFGLHKPSVVRHPTKLSEIESTDNLIGHASFYALTADRPHAKRILEQGPVFFPVNPPKKITLKRLFSMWLFRQRQVVCALKIAAGQNPSWFDRAITRAVLWWSCRFAQSQDSYLLSFHLCNALKYDPKQRFHNTILDWYMHETDRHRTLSRVLRSYLKDKEHPLIEYAMLALL